VVANIFPSFKIRYTKGHHKVSETPETQSQKKNSKVTEAKKSKEHRMCRKVKDTKALG